MTEPKEKKSLKIIIMENPLPDDGLGPQARIIPISSDDIAVSIVSHVANDNEADAGE